jgi:hypothetical protein
MYSLTKELSKDQMLEQTKYEKHVINFCIDLLKHKNLGGKDHFKRKIYVHVCM